MVAEPKQKGSNPFAPALDHKPRLPVAVSGFCVVSLREQRAWLRGAEAHQLTFDDQLYWFAGQRKQAMFAANPQRYVPALGGDCVVTFAEQGTRKRGNPQYGLVHDRRLFFFRHAAEQEKFRASPADYAQVDLANAGQCLVSKLDHQRKLPGLPETTVIVNGMRYLFAGAHQQKKFLANFKHYGVERASRDSVGKEKNTPPPVLAPSLVPLQAEPQVAQQKRVTPKVAPPSAANKAISGYCPVSIRDAGIWSLGEERFPATFDGQVYFMVGKEQQARFAADPAAYLPALGGHCVVSEVDDDKRTSGSIYHAAQYEGRLYLFAGAEKKKIFTANPELYANADLVADGDCIVSQIDTNQTVAGNPELLIWHRSRRYYFASSAEQAKFLENTLRYQQR